MAIFGASFSIGRSALAAYQSAISITGQNIANIANPDYARQSGRLEALRGGPRDGRVTPGGGVGMTALRRHFDASVETRLRNSNSALNNAQTVSGALSQTEALYAELSDHDISTQLTDFFATFSQLQTRPQDESYRGLIVNSAQGLIDSFQRQRSGLIGQVQDLNDEVVAGARQASEIADEIADLNRLIVAQEAGGAVASPLRDRREGLLREMSTLLQVDVREHENGSISVYVGSEPLVSFDRSRGLKVERVRRDGLEIAEVRFADSNGYVNIRDGKLAGVVAARDVHLRDQLNRLDRLAGGLIYEVNRIHSSGVGMVGYDSLRSDYAVDDADVPLNSDLANLPFPVNNGTLIVNVRDKASGQTITRQIEIDLDGLNNDDTTLNDLATALDGVPGLTASVNADRRLQITADSGQEFWVSEDSSGAFAALGLAGFFTGRDASDIQIASAIDNDPRRIAASLTGQLNDGDNAGLISRLSADSSISDLLNSKSISNFHAAMVDDLAVTAGGALTDSEAADAIYQNLIAQRESISGVNIDEEAINLSRFEQAYQGAARYLSVLDELGNEVLSLL